MVYTCIYILCTCTDSVHTCICTFIRVIYMFQHVYTLYIQIQRYSYMVYTGSNVYIQFFHKIKKKYNFRTWTNDLLMHTSKLSWPLCYQRACNRVKICCISKLFTWRLVTHVWRWTSSASQPGHDVSSASTRIALKPRPGAAPGHPTVALAVRPGRRLGPASSWLRSTSSESDCRAQAIKSDLTPSQSTIKLFVWAGISIKI